MLINKIHVSFLESEFEGFREYLTLIETHLDEKHKELEMWFEQISQGMDEEEKYRYDDMLSEQYWNLKQTYPNLLYKSFCITIYSFFENELNKFCRKAMKEKQIDVDIAEYSGNGIRRAQQYLKKEGCIDFPDQGREWKRILMFADVRNAITHTFGELKYLSEEKKRKLERVENTTIQNEDIYLSRDLFIQFIEDAKFILTKLYLQ
jgi:hypothetical protein